MNDERLQDTDEFLALHFPGIQKSWLQEVCETLRFVKFAGDMQVSFRGKGRKPFTKWTFIQGSVGQHEKDIH